MTTRIWYHGGCRDGFTAAYCAWLVLGDDAEYVPVTHGRPPPKVEEGATVYILDFSYKRPVILELIERLGPDGKLIILDHHASAEKELAGLDRHEHARAIASAHGGRAHVAIVFDMNKSGARLAWEYFNPYYAPELCPLFVRYVEDRDLWRFDLPDSKAINAVVAVTPMTFKAWNDLHDLFFNVPVLRARGEAILSHQDALVDRIIKSERFRSLAGHVVPTVNTCVLQSEVCARMCADSPNAPFSVAYFKGADGKTYVSLRSVGDFDVSALAAEYGGGGHRNAAGYSFKSWHGDQLTPIMGG